MRFRNRINYSFIVLLCLIVSVLTFSNPASVDAQEFDVYALVESFTWKEFINGSEILKESGPLYGFGLSAKATTYKSLTLKGRLELFGGSVDYDGQTQAGRSITTDTDYFGYKLELDTGWKLIVKETSSIEPFAGLGARLWNRDLQDRGTTIGTEEDWTSFYARVGVRGDHVYPNGLKVFAEGAVKIPIDNENEADLSPFGLGKVELDPGNEVSFFAEAGLKWKLLKIAVFYEGLRFSESDAERAAVNLFIYQPESEADIFGVRAGVSF